MKSETDNKGGVLHTGIDQAEAEAFIRYVENLNKEDRK